MFLLPPSSWHQCLAGKLISEGCQVLTKSIPQAFQATKRFRVTESDFEFEQLMAFAGPG